MLHAYCIRNAADPPPAPGLRGVGGGEVHAHGSGELSIWLSETEPLAPTLERLREHERVVRHALSTETPLPLRYGAVFGTEDAALAALDSRREEFTAALERVRGQVEMALRVSLAAGSMEDPPLPDPVAPGEGPGRSYLERRRAELAISEAGRERADSLLAELERKLSDLHLPTLRTADPRRNSVGSLAHLVHRDRLAAYRRRIAALRDAHPDLRLTLSGPWAPYSFVQ